MKSIQKFFIAKVFISFLSFAPNIYASDPSNLPPEEANDAPTNANCERRHVVPEDSEQKSENLLGHLICGICQNGYNMDSHPQVLQCGHTFCASCLNEMLDNDSVEKNCPNCRAPFSRPIAKNISLVEGHLNCENCQQIYNEGIHCPSVLKCGHTFCTPCVNAMPKNDLGQGNCSNCREPFLGLPQKNYSLIEAIQYHRGQNFQMLNCPDLAEVNEAIFSPKRFCFPDRSSVAIANPTDYDKPMRLVCELYNKQGQQARCWGRCIGALANFSRAFPYINELDPACPINFKTAAWTFAQTGFLLSDWEQHAKAAILLNMALQKFENQIQAEIARGASEGFLSLIRLDRNITWLHYAHQMLRLKWPLDLNALKFELDEVRRSFPPNSHRPMAQLEHTYAIYYHATGDWGLALAHAAKAIELTQIEAEGGAEICTWTLICILADIAERDNVASFAFLAPYKPHTWKIVAARAKARRKIPDDPTERFISKDPPEMAHALYDLGRLAIRFGFLKQGYDFMMRAVSSIMEMKAQFTYHRNKFRGDFRHSEFTLPEWVGSANEIIASLEQVLIAHPPQQGAYPEIEEIFRGL